MLDLIFVPSLESESLVHNIIEVRRTYNVFLHSYVYIDNKFYNNNFKKKRQII